MPWKTDYCSYLIHCAMGTTVSGSSVGFNETRRIRIPISVLSNQFTGATLFLEVNLKFISCTLGSRRSRQYSDRSILWDLNSIAVSLAHEKRLVVCSAFGPCNEAWCGAKRESERKNKVPPHDIGFSKAAIRDATPPVEQAWIINRDSIYPSLTTKASTDRHISTAPINTKNRPQPIGTGNTLLRSGAALKPPRSLIHEGPPCHATEAGETHIICWHNPNAIPYVSVDW